MSLRIMSMRLCLLVGILAVVCRSTLLPIDPIVWSYSGNLSSITSNNESIFFMSPTNSNVSCISAATGQVVWTVDAFWGPTFAVSNDVVVGTQFVSLHENRFVALSVRDGTMVHSRMMSSACGGGLTYLCGDYFLCIDGTTSAGTILDSTGAALWTSMNTGIAALQTTTCVVPSTGAPAILTTAFESNIPLLVMIDTRTWSYVAEPNITLMSTTSVQDTIICIAANGLVRALDVQASGPNGLEFLWTSANPVVLSTYSQVLIVGDAVVIVGCLSTSCALVSYSVDTGAYFGMATMTGAQRVGSIGILGGLVVAGWEGGDISQQAHIAHYDPIAAAWVLDTVNVPGLGVFTSITGNTTCPTMLVAPNAQGFSIINAVTLKPLSYNLNIPGTTSAIAFPGVPRWDQTTVVLLPPQQPLATSATAFILTC